MGLLSNLTAAKGMFRAVATYDECRRRGLDVELVLAGPVIEDREILDEQVADRPGVRLAGPVHGAAKDALLGGLDVFLFPSLYRNESFGLVVGEAMAAGCAAVAYRAGCLDQGWVGPGGLILDPDDDFAVRAADQVAAWAADRGALRAAQGAAVASAAAGRESGRRALDELAGLISAPGAGH